MVTCADGAFMVKGHIMRVKNGFMCTTPTNILTCENGLKADGKSTLPWTMHVMKLLHNQDSTHRLTPPTVTPVYIHVSCWARHRELAETSKLDTAVRSAPSSDGTWWCSVLFHQMSVALAWEIKVVVHVLGGLCRPVQTGFNRRTNPGHPLGLQSSLQVLQSCSALQQSPLRSARLGIPRTRRVYDNAMSYTNCTISFHNEATQPVFA